MAISHQRDEAFTQRTFTRPIPPGHFLVDHHRLLSGNAIFLHQEPSGDEPHAQGAKVIPTPYSNMPGAQGDGLLESFDTITAETSTADFVDGGCLDAWNGAQTLHHPFAPQKLPLHLFPEQCQIGHASPFSLHVIDF